MKEKTHNNYTFQPTIRNDEGFGQGCVDVRLSHALSLVLDSQQNRASFHFGGSMRGLKWDESGEMNESFKNRKDTLNVLLADIQIGLDNLIKIIIEGKITLPDKMIASTHNPFLARIYKGLPGTSINVQIFLPNYELRNIRVREERLPDLLHKLPEDQQYSLHYDYVVDLSSSEDKGKVVMELIENTLKPRISELIARLR
ncbi:MAG: hypothetical protein GW942_02270 [Candidatus Pacebacteria bacterium]|nr:hypothetical protein [Candidatus Paceibacterota bacterium]